ncbi:AAC(3) family N-acetyltransferase [Pseudomonas sp. F3-2]|uniref:AAC(3) family N-acetyltransferase n=1 Tax=Pseudomonas sp. F3-2 TaxID=3141539 RepID=UPI00315DF08C
MHDDVVDALAAEWKSAGLREGDTILVHSSLSRTLRRVIKMGGSADPNIVVRSFLRAIGDEGTLIVPLFNFDFTQGVPFDMRHSKSAMGSFTEAVRKWPEAVRTAHPIYSFAAVGRNALLFQNVDNFSGYGTDSPFAILHRLDGKIGVIDLPDQHSMTFYHYVEEANNVSYRYHKKFTGECTDLNGLSSTKTYGLFVRDIEHGVRTSVNSMGELLWEKKAYSGYRPGQGCGLRVINASVVFDETSKVIQSGQAKGLLYEVK